MSKNSVNIPFTSKFIYVLAVLAASYHIVAGMTFGSWISFNVAALWIMNIVNIHHFRNWERQSGS